MEANRTTRAIRILGVLVGGSFFILGIGELIVRLDDPTPLAFWLPTLWGGSFFILFGVFGRSVTPRNSRLFVILGAVLGLLPTVWTVIMPILSAALVILTIRRTSTKLEN
ncbi:MAG: hypothetical protein WC864_06025 [Ilumatobacteraceae bacterium]